MIRGKYLTSPGDGAEVALDIRRRVFGGEMGLAALAGPDEGDRMAVYALAFDEAGAPSGAGRLYIDEADRFMMDAVCVLKEARGKYLGDLIARMLLLRALELNANAVCARATPESAPFFERYGFKPQGGPETSRGISLLLLRATAAEIDIEGTCHKNAACQNCQGDCGACP